MQAKLVIDQQPQPILHRPDERADHRQPEQAVEDRAMSGEMLDSLTHDTRALANGAARVINVWRQRPQRREPIVDDFERQQIRHSMRIGRQRRTQQRVAGEVPDAVRDDSPGQPEDDVRWTLHPIPPLQKLSDLKRRGRRVQREEMLKPIGPDDTRSAHIAPPSECRYRYALLRNVTNHSPSLSERCALRVLRGSIRTLSATTKLARRGN